MADLDAVERGFVLGVFLANRAGASGSRPQTGPGPASEAGEAGMEETVSRLAEPSAGRCREAIRALANLARSERVRAIGLLAQEALSPLPAGFESVSPDLLHGVLARESVPVIRLLGAPGSGPSAASSPQLFLRQAATDLLRTLPDPEVDPDGHGQEMSSAMPGAPPEVVTELQRAVLAEIVAVPPLGPGAPVTRPGRRLGNLPPHELRAEVIVAGAALLGTSLQGCDEATLARAAACLPRSVADLVIAAAHPSSEASPAEQQARMAARARARTLVALVARSSGARAEDASARVNAPDPSSPERTLERLGACEIGERLGREDPELALSVGQRLRADLRQELLRAAEIAAGEPPSSPSG
jgi:hypothetical protein